ncbi:1,4-alpha-glucan branching enzyme [Geomonas sp. Red276]
MALTTEGQGLYASEYRMQDLGAVRVEEGVRFRAWLPFAGDVRLVVYDDNRNERSYPMLNEWNDCWSVTVADVKEGEQYLYRVDGKDKSDPRAQLMVGAADNSIVYLGGYDWKVNDFRMAPWNELVIYQMHTGTYPDKSVEGSELLKGVLDDLWYLQKLGVNAIQLLPTSEFPTERSWGYNPAGLFAVEADYGGPAALKQFVDAAHARGIAVLLDVVYNHLNPEGPKSLWQITPWQQPFSVDGGPLQDGGGVYFYNDPRAATPWGSRPDYGRPQVRDYLRDNLMMWLLEYRIDGVRFDSVVNIRNAKGNNNDPAHDLPDGWRLLQEMNNCVRAEHGKRNLLTIAEDLQGNEWITKDTGAGGAGFGAQWDAAFIGVSRDQLAKSWDGDRNMDEIRRIVEGSYGPDRYQRVVAIETHDQAAHSRLTDCIDFARVDESWLVRKRIGLGTALMMASPGMPMFLQGQELLEWRKFGDNRAVNGVDWSRFCDVDTDCRSCLTSRLKCLSAAGGPCEKSISCSDCPELPERCAPQGKFSGIYQLYQDLIRLRRNWYNNTRGLRGQNVNVFHVNNSDKLVAFHRWEAGGGGDDVVVILNFANRSYDSYLLGLPRGGKWEVRFNSDSRAYDPGFGNFGSFATEARPASRDGLSFEANISIAPYSALILSQ